MTTGEPSPYEPSQERRQQPGPGGASSTAPQRRTGFRRYLPLLAAAWVVLEIWLLIWLAGHVSALGVFAALLAGFVLGAVIIKRAGRKAWRNLAESVQPGATEGQADTALKSGGKRESGGNGLAMLGGLLLMLPGLASDVLGLLCVFPPTAALLRKAVKRSIASSSLGDAMEQAKAAQQQVRMHRPDGKVVPGEVIRDADAAGQDQDRPGSRPDSRDV